MLEKKKNFKISITNRSAMVENINSDIAASVIDISAFRRFVVRPTAILFFLEQQSILSR
jgi:hypothetical protein